MPLTTISPSLSHFVIFNPTLKLPPIPRDDNLERDKDLEDDLREAAQILFYTSRGSGGVSRDKMLRQTGLIKGIMGFTDMVVKDESGKGYWSISSQKSRLLVFVPEPNFYIYINITLAQTIPEGSVDNAKESIVTSQVLSDDRLIDGLSKGYEDFRLLHGAINDLLPPSPFLSTILDKFWTRFAFSFESTHISNEPSADTLSSWLGGYPSPPDQIAQGVERAIEVFIEDSDLPRSTLYGVVNKDGPLHTTADDPPLIRFLVSLVQTSLPPPAVEVPKHDARQTLGFGLSRKRDDGSRKTSWATFSSAAVGWVPTLGGSTPRSVTPVSADIREPTATVVEKDKPRWSFGLPTMGIGEAMGSVGTVLGLGNKVEPVAREGPKVDKPIGAGAAGVPIAAALANNGGNHATDFTGVDEENTGSTSEAIGSLSVHDRSMASNQVSECDDHASSIHHVEQTPVDLPDLQAAVEPEREIELGWEQRNVWVKSEETWVRGRLIWLIRDGILLYILQAADIPAPYFMPSSRETLSLYSRLNTILTPDRVSTDSARPTQVPAANSSIMVFGGVTETKGPDLDSMAATSLAELRDILQSDSSIHEIYARTPASKFVIAKRTRTTSGLSEDSASRKAESPGELYMSIGRKDASLTDAEHAIRGYMRSRPEIA